jgi:hypothetical protein
VFARLIDQMKGVLSLANGVHDEPAIECGQLAPVDRCQGQQVRIAYLRRVKESREVDFSAIQKAEIVWPEIVAG